MKLGLESGSSSNESAEDETVDGSPECRSPVDEGR